MKIVFITTGQPTLNPRLVKEADALANAGYNVTVLYAYWNNWASGFDSALLEKKKWKAICIAGHPTNSKTTFFLSRLIYNTALFFTRKLAAGNWLGNWAIARSSYFLIKEARKHTTDLFIAHNLGALPAAVIAAKKHGKPCGFDAEDFHRNELSDNPQDKDVILKTNIENKYFPQLSYLTVSSPQIGAAYQKLFPQLNPLVLLNVFAKSRVNIGNIKTHSPIKLFWFSQTIGENRGLEDISAALSQLNKSAFELHLLGHKPHYANNFINKLSGSGIRVFFHDPVPADQVINFAAQFDIGLALEAKEPLNRDICLTNKIFTYLQAGLAVIASNTTAQLNFIENNPQAGFAYTKGNVNELAVILTQFETNTGMLLHCRQAALKLGHDIYNWENERVKFLTLINKTLNS